MVEKRQSTSHDQVAGASARGNAQAGSAVPLTRPAVRIRCQLRTLHTQKAAKSYTGYYQALCSALALFSFGCGLSCPLACDEFRGLQPPPTWDCSFVPSSDTSAGTPRNGPDRGPSSHMSHCPASTRRKENSPLLSRTDVAQPTLRLDYTVLQVFLRRNHDVGQHKPCTCTSQSVSRARPPQSTCRSKLRRKNTMAATRRVWTWPCSSSKPRPRRSPCPECRGHERGWSCCWLSGSSLSFG